jgi:transcriptional regulator with XRE-family HTH domain
MGTLGQLLRSARESLGIELRDAAQQTRISHNYLQALENEDFSKLPGEVFVKGFLKNYGKFLGLDETEVMKRYEELRSPGPVPPAPAAAPEKEQPAQPSEPKETKKTPIEPFIWVAGIVIMIGIFFFTALPKRHAPEAPGTATKAPEGPLEPAPVLSPKPEKLYLEVIALESTWILVRTDNSPQKKAILKEGESLIWSADERFLLSYGSAGAVKLLLNGQELTVKEPKNAVVRDLAITAAGIVSKNNPEYSKPARPKQQAGPLQEQPSGQPTSTMTRKPLVSRPTSTAQRKPMESQPTSTAQRKSAAAQQEKKSTPTSTMPLQAPMPWQGPND